MNNYYSNIDYNIDSIVVIDGLSSKDGTVFTGESLYNDIIKRHIELYDRDLKHKFYKVNIKDDLISIFSEINFDELIALEGVIFHFEFHGDENYKGLVLPNNDLVSWEDICDLLRPLNIKTCNKVFVTMGSCFGRKLYKGVDPNKKSPYSGYISAKDSVNNDDIYEIFSEFFINVISNKKIINAYKKIEELKTNFFYKDSFTIFKEAFKMTIEDSEEQKRIIDSAKKSYKKEFGLDVNDNTLIIIRQKVMNDIFLERLNSFYFKQQNKID